MKLSSKANFVAVILLVLAASASALAATEWVEVKVTQIGNQDNVLASVAANSPSDVWAVGQYVQQSNPNITQTLVQHYDGSSWSIIASPNTGTLANAFFSVTAQGGLAWAVGYYMDDTTYQAQSLIAAWDGTQWNLVNHPHAGLADQLLGVSALSSTDIWAVGFQRNTNGQGSGLIEHFDGNAWKIVDGPNPGATSNLFYSVVATSHKSVWAVGSQTGTQNPDAALIAHWDGSTWTVENSPAEGSASLALYGVTGISDDAILAVGDAQDNLSPPQNLAVTGNNGKFSLSSVKNVGKGENHLYAAYTFSKNLSIVVGESGVVSTGNLNTLAEVNTGSGWVLESTPSPSKSGNSQLGAVVAVSATEAWAVGAYDAANSRALVLHRVTK